MQPQQWQDEPPSLLWGLDPVFSAHARLYIKDILEMKESYQVPGIYFYKNHPIVKVDVLGTVVYKREREDFFCYGVDDGTGVISCLCWKDEKWREPTESGSSRNTLLLMGHGFFCPAEQLKKLKQAQQLISCLELGDLLRVRGSVKMSRQQREIKASCYYKVNDPVMAVQISWMMEVPQMYRKVYDKPFDFTQCARDLNCADSRDVPSSVPLLQRAIKMLKDLLSRDAVESFRLKDVKHIFVPLVSQSTTEQPEPTAVQSSTKEVCHLFLETVKALEDEGLVFRKVISQDEVYQVTEHDRELHRVTKDIIREDSKREKYAERGCHVLHILSCVRRTYSQNVSRAVIEAVLRSLECESEIVSTTDNYYTVF
ncbi:CST complex subunit STN1 [Scleropages formosus]|uniref:CST complex subunit STN1 n=1 Tax=Scleropages formosus TaxID=113540 RepID=A0A8C9R7I6_SCLFO|nr:CST complex subunit STN1 [Scleropages formosus]XP_029114942.1 CST complex subunit STN1 [Scleropages formosus]